MPLSFAPTLLALLQVATPTDTNTYNGRAGQLSVSAPRVDAAIVVDGVLDEPVWQRAAVLTGFSLYQPIDKRPAPDSTEVLVWYSANALHFGIRAYEPHGEVRATLAERDRVSSDDNIELLLDTFGDNRRAFVFIVNALGVQADGTKSETGGFIPGSNVMPGQNDLSADFVWESRGRVTDAGYEVEVRVPFSSLRYPVRDVQSWGIQVVRNVQHSGYEETWTPAIKASASFISQSGRLVGLTGMHHGQVVELNPEFTTSLEGDPDVPSGEWGYTANPTLGGNIRWGIGSNFVLNGTVRPDFSQVEADALQLAGDARFALFYPEKRPFFVEGSEQFNVPNTLVYTRRIAHPTVATKLTGRIGQMDIAALSALDDRQASHTGTDQPVVNIVRLRRDFAGQSTAGVLLSDRTEGAAFNRVGEADVRVVFGGMYFAQVQLAASSTRLPGGDTRTAPMWEATVDRTGRAFGFNYSLLAIDRDFDAWSGFVPRTGFVQGALRNRYTAYGAPGALLERYNVFVSTEGTWRHHDFFAGRSMLESSASANNEVTLRGGWSVSLTPSVASYVFDANDYADYYVSDNSGTPQPFTPSPRTSTALLGVRASTPEFQHFSASAGATFGNDVDFFETSRVRRADVNASADWRPTDRIRVNGSYVSSKFTRRSDGEVTTTARIPRLKLEYQLSRPLFVRFVGQYEARTRAPLRDPATGDVILLRTGNSYVASTPANTNGLRVDWLVSYRPAPGTVVFAGYGSSLAEEDPLAFNHLRRTRDGFFVKLSYLWRM